MNLESRGRFSEYCSPERPSSLKGLSVFHENVKTFTGWAAKGIETRRLKLLSFFALLQSFALERCLDLFYIIFSWTFLEFQNWNAPKNAKNASTNDPSIWKQFKDARNWANNSVKKAKRKYFSESLDANKSDPRKTWRLISAK